jgi:hypothetical protein
MEERYDAIVPGSKEGKIIGDAGVITCSFIIKLRKSATKATLEENAKAAAHMLYNRITTEFRFDRCHLSSRSANSINKITFRE